MSARLEADSQMLSSPDDSDTEVEPTHLPSSSSAVLSPPSSQHRGGGTGGGDDPSSPNMPTTASGATLANSNGKRPIQTISNGNDDAEGKQLPVLLWEGRISHVKKGKKNEMKH